MKVIGLAGTIGAGKDTVGDYIAEKYGYKSITYGDIVRELCVKHGLEPNRENCQAMQKDYREKYGKDYFAKLVVGKIKENKWQKVIINGVRIPEDAIAPKTAFGNDFILILVDAEPHLRFERLKGRKRLGDPETFEEFQKQEKAEKEMFNFDEVLKHVNHTVKNEGTYEELHKKIDVLLKKIGFA